MADSGIYDDDTPSQPPNPKIASNRSSFLLHRKHSVTSTFDFDDDDDDGGEESWSSGAEDSDGDATGRYVVWSTGDGCDAPVALIMLLTLVFMGVQRI